MRKYGWGGTLVAVGMTFAAVMPASAGYVLSMSGPATVDAGSTVTVNAVLTGSGPHDSMIFDVGVSGPRPLAYNGYQLAGNVQYQTGSPDDFSVPKGALDTGALAQLAFNGAHFEAITRSGMTFDTGTVASMTLAIPAAAQPGEVFVFDPRPDTFALGFDIVPTTAGDSLRLTVVPEPATLALLGLGGLLAARRRFLA